MTANSAGFLNRDSCIQINYIMVSNISVFMEYIIRDTELIYYK